MSRSRLARRDERERDPRFLDLRELRLRLLGRFLETLERHTVFTEIDSRLSLKAFDQPVDDRPVEILSPEKGVSRGRQHLEQPLLDLEDGNIERAPAEIVDGDGLIACVLHSVGQRRGGRLVDDPEDLEPRDPAGVFGGLAL